MIEILIVTEFCSLASQTKLLLRNCTKDNNLMITRYGKLCHLYPHLKIESKPSFSWMSGVNLSSE